MPMPGVRLLFLALVAAASVGCLRQSKQPSRYNRPFQADEEPAIVINSKHSGAPLDRGAPHQVAAGQVSQQPKYRTQPHHRDQAAAGQWNRTATRHQVAQQSSQPSQEFDETAHSGSSPASRDRPLAISPTTIPSGQQQHLRRKEPSSGSGSPVSSVVSSLIRDTSELLASSQPRESLELEQRRAAALPVSISTTTESWMQSVRDNHHGPLRSRFNLASGGFGLHSSLSSQMNTRRLVSGEHVTPVGDNQQLVLDGHMKTKPGPSQPVPYEQQLLAKSVRTDEPFVVETTTRSAAYLDKQRYTGRRNSKFTRRSTEFAPSEPEDSSTTPLYEEPAASGSGLTPSTSSKAVSATKDNATGGSSGAKEQAPINKLPDKTRAADFKTVLISNNHRPAPGAKLKERRFSSGKTKGRMLAAELERTKRSDSKRYDPSSGEQSRQQQSQPIGQQPQKGGWSRLLPNLLQRTFRGVFKRLTTTSAPGSNSAAPANQAAAQSLYNSFAPAPSRIAVLPAAGPPVLATPAPSLGVVNYIASALSAAIAAAAAANSNRQSLPAASKHQVTLEGELHHESPSHMFNGVQLGSNSIHYDTRDPDLRQHANKKIIDSSVDLPVSERRLGDSARIGKQPLGSDIGGKRQARMSATHDQEFELDTRSMTGNGTWSLDLMESAPEAGADSNRTETTNDKAQANNESEPTRAASAPGQDGEELDEDDRLDFRTTTDGSVGVDDADMLEGDEPNEPLEASDSINIPEGMAYEVAHNLGEPLVSNRRSGADEQEQPRDEEELVGEEDEGGFSLFYAPAPSEVVKNYRKHSGESEGGAEGDGEGSFARIFPPATSSPVSGDHSGRQRHGPKSTIRRPAPAPIDPDLTGADDTGDAEMADMTLMVVPARMRPQPQPPGRRRPSSGHRKPPAAIVQAISLKKTFERTTTSPRIKSQSKNKNKTSAKPTVESIFESPKVHEMQKANEMMSPMSSSISVMDLDPSMTRLAHNKLIVAKFKPKIKQQGQGLLHRSTTGGLESTTAATGRRPSHPSGSSTSLSSALLASTAAMDQDGLNEMVSRRWQMRPRSSISGPTMESASSSGQVKDNSTSRNEPDAKPLRVVSDFQFLMPGLASSLAARINSLTRPQAAGPASTPAPTAAEEVSVSVGPTETSRDRDRDREASSVGESQPVQSPYGGIRNDKFNFSLVQMNSRERINPLLFPMERFSNSSSYSVQQQQKEQQKSKPSNQRSRVTTSTLRPTTPRQSNYTDSTSPTTQVAPTKPSATAGPAKQQVRTTSKPSSTSARTVSTTTARPRTTTATPTTNTTKLATDDDSIGQILRNQHHNTAFQNGHRSPPPPPPRNRPLTESERLRNQYLAMIGKNASLDGRIWPTAAQLDEAGEPLTGYQQQQQQQQHSTLNPLGHMSLVEAARDTNRYTTLEAAPELAGSGPSNEQSGLLAEHSIVIISDNHHRQATSNRRAGILASSSPPTSQLPAFGAGHTRYELSLRPPVVQEAARKYLEEFVNGTRIRPSSLSKIVGSPMPQVPAIQQPTLNVTGNLVQSNRRAQGGAFNSVQGSPPSPFEVGSSNPLIGRLDLRAQGLLSDLIEREPGHLSKSDSPRKVYTQEDHQQQQQNVSSAADTSANDHDRIKTQSTKTLIPLSATLDSSTEGQSIDADRTEDLAMSTMSTPTTSGQASAQNERADLDSGESDELNRRASMRKDQAKIQSLLAAIANKTRPASTSQAPASGDEGNNNEHGDQEFKTTLAALDYSITDADEASMETTRFYAPVKLTTRSSYQVRPPMSTPAPGRTGYPNIETLSGSRQKINKPAQGSANYDYSPTISSQAPPVDMPTTKLTESPTNDQQLKQTIKNRLGDDSVRLGSDAQAQAQPTTGSQPADSSETPSGPTFVDEPAASASSESTAQDETTPIAASEPDSEEPTNRRRPTVSLDSNSIEPTADYPEMPAFPQSKPLRPTIIRRRPTRRPTSNRLAGATNSNEDLNSDNDAHDYAGRPHLIVANRPRRRKKPVKRPETDVASAEGYKDDKRKVIYRPINVAELGESPVIIRKRPGYMGQAYPDSIRIYPQPAERNRPPSASVNISAPVSIILPSTSTVLKRKDQDVRTRPLTIMDPQPSASGDHLANEAVLNPMILTRIPETTIMHDKMLVSYKPGRPLPGSMSSFSARPSKPHQQTPSSSSSSSSTLDSLISSIASSAGPTQNTSLTRPPQLGSGNGGDTHLISIEQQMREQQSSTTRQPLQSSTASGLLDQQQTSGPSSTPAELISAISSPTGGLSSTGNASLGSQTSPPSNQSSHNQRPIIVISGLFGDTSSQQVEQQPRPGHGQELHKRPSSGLASNSLLEAGSMSVLAHASHGQTNSSRPWYTTVSSWPTRQNSSQSHSEQAANSSSPSSSADLAAGQSSSSMEQLVFGGSDMPNFGATGSGPSSSPSGSYQNHQLQHQQHIGMPYQGSSGGGSSGGRPGQRPNKWRVRRRPQGNNGPSSGGAGSNAGYNFNSASSVSNYVYRPIVSSLNSFGVLFDNVQVFFARIRTFIISLMVMFLPPLALAASIVNAMSV